MQKLFIILSSIILSLCSYKELSKGDTINVIPRTNVYFDISSFDVGETISFEFEMDLFFGDPITRTQYQFRIGQVSTASYSDSYYWDNLQTVTNKNVTCDSTHVCTFTWEEKKQTGNTFIFIYPPEPFADFYSRWNEKIKITHIGDSDGLSAGAIVGIVFACLFFIAIIVLLIVFCCCCNGNTNGCCYQCCPSCTLCCCPSRYRVAPVPYPVSYGSAMQVGVQPPIYGTHVIPAYPTPVPAVYSAGYM